MYRLWGGGQRRVEAGRRDSDRKCCDSLARMVGIRCCTRYLSHVTVTSNGLGPYTNALFRQDKIDVRFTTTTAMNSGILVLNSALNSLSPMRCAWWWRKKKIWWF